MRRGTGTESPVDVLSQMGYLYSREGEFLKALVYFQEATDSLSSRGDADLSDKEVAEAIKLYGNTSNLYTRMGLYDEAKDLSDKAVALAVARNRNFLSDLYRMRAVIYEFQLKLDSMLMCQRRALAEAVAITDSDWRARSVVMSQNVMAWAYIEHPDYRPDSIAGAVKVLERNIAVSTTVPTDSLLAGRGYVLLGNTSKGLPMLRAMVEPLRLRGGEDLEFAMRMLAESLVESSLTPSDLDTYRTSRRLTDSMESNLKANALVGADFRYRTSRILSDNLSLEKELTLTRQRNLLLWITSFLGAVIIVALVIAGIRRKNRLLRAHRAEIDNLIGERIRLNMEIERMRTDMQNQMKENDGTGIEDSGEAPDTSEIFSMVLLTQKDEARFRRLFSLLHPGFIEKVRVSHPEISPNAELVLMLIRLRKSNDEIALALGIKRDSVAKARYRLRSLFGLPKDTELNDFVMQS